MKDFIDRIQSDILVGDGAMGTALMSLGAPEGVALERLNLTDPEKVSAVHRGYGHIGIGLDCVVSLFDIYKPPAHGGS